MKKNYTVCFMVTGGITVEAESEEEAIAIARSEESMEDISESLLANALTITEVYEEDDE